MPKRRANNEGSIYRNATKDRWDGKVSVNGRRKVVTGKTRKEVLNKLADLRRQIDNTGGVPEADVTVARYLAWWLSDVLPRTASTGTVQNYNDIVRLYIEPTIGKVKLTQLRPDHVRTMVATIAAQGLSPNTQRLARSVLRRALRTAESDGRVTRNVAALVDGVRVPAPEGRTLTIDDARKLLDVARGHRLEAAVVVALTTGLRRGELLGLTWEDVDLKRGTLTIRRALKRRAGGLVLEEPKTRGSRRTVHIGKLGVDALKAHRASQATEKLKAGPMWSTEWPAMVFTSQVGTPADPDHFKHLISQLTTKAGLGHWSPHELRHSAASLLIAQGVDLKVISETLGHASIRQTADTYGHLMGDAKKVAATAMDDALS